MKQFATSIKFQIDYLTALNISLYVICFVSVSYLGKSLRQYPIKNIPINIQCTLFSFFFFNFLNNSSLLLLAL